MEVSTTCFGHTGKPKLRFDTAEEASGYRHEHKQRGDKLIYECSKCDGFHLATRLDRAIKRGWKRPNSMDYTEENWPEILEFLGWDWDDFDKQWFPSRIVIRQGQIALPGDTFVKAPDGRISVTQRGSSEADDD